jgi:histone deacetylase complex regulatory component SIN3
MDGMALPDDQQRAVLAARMHELEQALHQLSDGREAQDRCVEAARHLMASLQALINRMRQR